MPCIRRGTTAGGWAWNSGIPTLTLPTGSGVGDIVVLCIAAYTSQNSDLTWPVPSYFTFDAGWNLITEQNLIPGSGGQGRYMVLLWRLVGAGESGYRVATDVGLNLTEYVMTVYSGQGATPIDDFQYTLQSTDSATLTAPSATTSGVYHQLLLFYSPSLASFTLPGGVTQQAAVGPVPSIVYADKQIPTATTTGTQTLTYGVGSTIGIAAAVVLAASHVAVQITGAGNIDAKEKIGPPLVTVVEPPNGSTSFLQEDGAELVILVEANPYDKAGSSPQPVYLADGDYATLPSETPPNVEYNQVLDESLNVRKSIIGNGMLGGRGFPAISDVSVIVADQADYDGFDELSWDGRLLDFKAVGYRRNGDRVPYADAYRIARARSKKWRGDLRRAAIAVSDAAALFEKRLVQSLRYAGTGGLEGGPELANKPKPICVGKPRNFTPVLVDKNGPTYQFHFDGVTECAELEDVFSGGYRFSDDDVVVDMVNGTFTLLVAPAPGSVVTCNVTGPADVGYTAGELCIYFLSTIGPLAFPADFNSGAIYSYISEYDGDVQMYVDSERTISDVIAELIEPGGFWTIDNDGNIKIGLWQLPIGNPVASFTGAIVEDDDEGDIIDIQPLETDPPASQVLLDWGKNWTLQDAENLSGGTTTEQALFASQEYRTLSTGPEDALILQANPSATPIHLRCALVDQDKAQEELDRIAPILMITWKGFVVTTGPDGWVVDIGHLVFLKYDRFGLDDGRMMRAAEVAYFRRGATLVLWRTVADEALAIADGFAVEIAPGIGIRL